MNTDVWVFCVCLCDYYFSIKQQGLFYAHIQGKHTRFFVASFVEHWLQYEMSQTDP